ncbi:hypothetical protein I3760_08G093900 [Carya illinoinensis]|nr:hypothetical protein I3760_08G093900 [Carya illinoinensis]
MANSGGFNFTRTHGSDYFYYPPLVCIHRQLQLWQQRTVRSEPETWTNKEESALSKHNSSCSSFPHRNADTSNLNRHLESITPIVPAQTKPTSLIVSFSCETCEADGPPSFCLGDLWESSREWSTYGVGVQLLMNGRYSIKHVLFLSGIELYIDPHKLRPAEDGNAEFSRDIRSTSSSDCEEKRLAKNDVDRAWVQHNRINLNSQRLRRLTLRDRPPICSFNVTEDCSSGELLVFEYFEQEKPYDRQPLYDIEIPVGPTLQSQDASSPTFNSLSTHSRSTLSLSLSHTHQNIFGIEASSTISLPAFGLATYKLRGSILTPSGAKECQQVNFLLGAAEIWLQQLQVNLPDFRFFASCNSQRR